MRTIELKEWQQSTLPIPLSSEERDWLRTKIRDIEITPAPGAAEAYLLRPHSTIGTVAREDLAIEIRPKVPMSRVLFLLAYALQPKAWTRIAFDYAAEFDLFEAVIPGFVELVRRALERGPLQAYQLHEEALQTVRGRIRFDDQLRGHYGIAPPIEVRYDLYTENIVENRILKAALTRLRRMRLRSSESRRLLHVFDAQLVDVDDVGYTAKNLPDVVYSRLNERYRPAVELAKLILAGTSFELSHGTVTATTVLFDMNKIFEDFVVAALREALGPDGGRLSHGAHKRSLYLDDSLRIRLKPDISLWRGLTCEFVGDVKYKKLEPAGFEHADLYQLLAYTVATRLPVGVLIYAAGEDEPAIHTTVHLGTELRIRTLDLTGPPIAILEQVALLAREMRVLARRAGLARLVA
jgi:5-methylcytosine-specific restriction enzyme subunit McrC